MGVEADLYVEIFAGYIFIMVLSTKSQIFLGLFKVPVARDEFYILMNPNRFVDSDLERDFSYDEIKRVKSLVRSQ